jgi:phosphodiesterase/alkaline phosphatase D-like protein
VRYGPVGQALDRISPPVQTRLEDDNTGWVFIEGLDPETSYDYRVSAGEHDLGLPDLAGKFRTLPAAEDYHHPQTNPRGLFNFAFEFACGNNPRPATSLGWSMPTYATMLRELPGQVDFSILNGDWLYEEGRETPPERWRDQVGINEDQTPRLVRLAPAIVGVWVNYKIFLERCAPLAAWHRIVPHYFTIDDHEILDDVHATATPGHVHRRSVFRDVATLAWYDYLAWSNPTAHDQPIHLGRGRMRAGDDVLVDPEADFTALDLAQASTLHVHWGTPTDGVDDAALDAEPPANPNAGVYAIEEVLGPHRLRIRPPAPADSEGTYSIGRHNWGRFRLANCDFYLLDTRSERDMHDLSRPWAERSMIGAAQRQWLIESMEASDADFFFVISSVNFMIPHRASPKGDAAAAQLAYANKDDAWTAFLAERERIIKLFESLGRPVFILTGDLHNSYAVKISDRVWEFASGPHNSQNHPATSEGGRPASGPFDSLGRPCEIRWSTWFLYDTPRHLQFQPVYTVVRVNNVFNNPDPEGHDRWVAYPCPQVTFAYHDGFSGRLLYAESVPAGLEAIQAGP